MKPYLLASLFAGGVTSLSGCGGHVAVTTTDAGPASGATTSDAAMTMPAVTMPKLTTVAEVCQAMCHRLEMVACMKLMCVADCQKALVLPVCSNSYVDFLNCALAQPFLCDNGVADLMGACAAEKATFLSCRMGLTTPQPDAEPPPIIEPPPPDPPPLPTYDGGRTTACQEIPLLPETASCEETGTDFGLDAGDAGDDAEVRAPVPYPTCSRTCREAPGAKEWVAKCADGKCVCTYGGGLGCTCPQKQFSCGLECCF
jgi:hypothetical protein